MSDPLITLRNKHIEICHSLNLTNFSIAGGYVRDLFAGDKPSDVDLFFDCQKSFNESIELMEYQAKKIKQRKNSVLFKLKSGEEIDLIYCDGRTIAEIVFDFDILSCCAFFNQIDGLISKDGWLRNCELKIIMLNMVKYPYLTLGRIAKLKKRGWLIDSNQEANILDYCYKAAWGPEKEDEYGS